jgi:hypothetical protein
LVKVIGHSPGNTGCGSAASLQQREVGSTMIGCASGKSKLLLASPLTNIYFPKMSLSASKAFALALVLVCAFGAEQASARSKKPRLEPSSGPSVISVPSIMVDETGTPVIMQGLERPRRAIQGRHHIKKEAERRTNIPRGSATFVPPVSSIGSLPRTPLLVQPPAVAPYNPPPISNPSERIMQLNQSFPLNAGLGNNPTDRDGYVRYNFNR